MAGYGIIEVDLHGLSAYDARKRINSALRGANSATYRIKCIHGYHSGTSIRDMIQDEFRYGRLPGVKRITMGDNEGITELILREL